MENYNSRIQDVKLGLVGISGYAGFLGHELTHGGMAGRGVRLSTVYAPDPEQHSERIAQLASMGTTFHASFESLLQDDLDAVWLPVPIHLHRGMTEAAIAHRIPVICEKPVAATIDDALAMRTASRLAGVPVLVGFQNLFEPATLELKRALLETRQGAPLHAFVTGGWPRGSHYYRRNNWAGRLRYRGAWVLDGPASNAMGHFINLAAFLLGTSIDSSARPVSIQAELYRAKAIDSYDTFSARVCFEDESTMTVLLTHACDREVEPTVRISGTRLGAVWRDQHEQIELQAGGQLRLINRHVDGREALVQRIADIEGSGPAASIDSSLAHTVIVNGAFEATPIHDVPQTASRRVKTSQQGTVTVIEGIEAALETVAARGKLLSELGIFDWARPGGSFDLRGYRQFQGRKLPSVDTGANAVITAVGGVPPKRTALRQSSEQSLHRQIGSK